jgi:hypothetical protein
MCTEDFSILRTCSTKIECLDKLDRACEVRGQRQLGFGGSPSNSCCTASRVFKGFGGLREQR